MRESEVIERIEAESKERAAKAMRDPEMLNEVRRLLSSDVVMEVAAIGWEAAYLVRAQAERIEQLEREVAGRKNFTTRLSATAGRAESRYSHAKEEVGKLVARNEDLLHHIAVLKHQLGHFGLTPFEPCPSQMEGIRCLLGVGHEGQHRMAE